ncbi:MAG TPA: hypothetical protein VGV38_10900 [Pyrinomonadaceae bacterium]|nr:hypothetical protein [Pyrinomonadaceae bacterium]
MSRARPEIAHDILRYMRANPEAADTLEGIAEWWLHRKYSEESVREMLVELVAEGVLAEFRGSELRTIYRMNKAG